MIRTVEIVWQSPCKRGHVELRRGLYWCYIGAAHVGTQLHESAAVELVERKLRDGHTIRINSAATE